MSLRGSTSFNVQFRFVLSLARGELRCAIFYSAIALNAFVVTSAAKVTSLVEKALSSTREANDVVKLAKLELEDIAYRTCDAAQSIVHWSPITGPYRSETYL
jgi:hypothetical protein